MTSLVAPIHLNHGPASSLAENDLDPKKRIEFKRILDSNFSYADDQAHYRPRTDPETRISYWNKIVDQKKALRPKPIGLQTWIQVENAAESEIESYPKFYVLVAKFVTSSLWDQWYLNMVIVWLVLLVVIDESSPSTSGKTNTIPVVIPPVSAVAPLCIMIILEIVPILGTVYLMVRCNDLMHTLAVINFGDWAFPSFIIAQYIENFYFGGINRQEHAGKCKLAADVKIIAQPRKSKILVGAEIADDLDSFVDGREKRSLSMDSEESQMHKGVFERQISFQSSISGASGESDQLASWSAVPSPKERDIIPTSTSESSRGTSSSLLLEWKCVTCSTMNCAPRHNNFKPQVLAESVGVLYTRTYAVIKPVRDIPKCKKCFTDADYVPSKVTAHLFKNYPERYIAFSNYPLKVDVQPGLSRWTLLKIGKKIRSFLFGVKDDPESFLLFNDWRIRKYLPSKFLKIPRAIKPPSEFYKIGEIIECKHQKFEWARARILLARINHTYDIKYDTGETLRYVNEKLIRLPPYKRTYAYRAEMSMVFIIATFPICALAAIRINTGFVFAGILIVGIYLTLLRIGIFIKYIYKYSAAGLCSLIGINTLYFAPVFLLFLTGAIANSGQANFYQVYYAMTVSLILSLGPLLMMRPSFCLIGAVIFIQVIIGGYFVISVLSSSGSVKLRYAVIPFITAAITAKIVRRYLHTLTDASLIIRPPQDFLDKPKKTAHWRIGRVYDIATTMTSNV